MEPKPKRESKTHWTNFVGLVAVLVAQPQFGELLPQEATPWIAAALPILNMILRQYTTQPVEPVFEKKTVQ